MKKYFLLLLIPVFVASCGREAKKKAELLQARNDSLLTQSVQKDEAINEFVRSINEIQGTLDTIKMKENIINLSAEKGGELRKTAKDQIKTDIQTIYSMMEKNKAQLSALSKKLKAANMKVDELQKMVARLEKDIADKSAEIEDLRGKLSKMNIKFEAASMKIDTLSKTVSDQNQKLTDQTQTIAVQEEALNTAYYVIGTSKELKDNGVVKKGEVLADFNKELFTKIDIRKVSELAILKKKAKILSNHPASSYKFTGDKKVIQSLQILDYKAFWSNSKYLVIMVD